MGLWWLIVAVLFPCYCHSFHYCSSFTSMTTSDELATERGLSAVFDRCEYKEGGGLFCSWLVQMG